MQLRVRSITKQEHRKRGNIRLQLSNIPSLYDLCQGEVDAEKRGSKLNLIKKNGEKGGGGGYERITLQL